MLPSPVGSQATPRYWSLAAGPKLAAHVVCFWAQAFEPGRTRSRYALYPDGCSRLLFSVNTGVQLIGPHTDPVVSWADGEILLGIRLRPGIAPALLGISGTDMLNRTFAREKKLGGFESTLVKLFSSSDPIQAKLLMLRTMAGERLVQAEAQDPVILKSVEMIANTPSISINEIAETLDVSSRHLQRRFRSATGYGPKTFSRLIRFQRLLSLTNTTGGSSSNLASLAVEAGYSDQSHMTREVRVIAKCRPTEILDDLKSTFFVSDSFKTDIYSPPILPGLAISSQ